MKFIFILVFTLIIAYQNFPQKVVVGYINGNYASYPYNAIDYSSLTHIAHAFVIPNADGSLHIDSWFLYPQLISEAHKYNVKVLAAVGDFGQSAGFSPMAANPVAREKFINNMVNFCKTHGYDGVDLDWEYPGAADRANFAALVSELRTALLAAEIPLLTAAIPSQDWNNAYDLNSLKNNFDWFGIMTYDFYGSWESISGHQSALYSYGSQNLSVDKAVKYYLGRGVPAEQLCIGIPFGGYLLNSQGLFKSNSGGSSVSYVAANEKINQGWEYLWDDNCKVPYLQNPAHTQLITYDDTISVKLKSAYIIKNNLKGTIIWKIGRDYSAGKTPLLKSLGDYLLNPPAEAPSVPQLIFPADDSIIDSQSIRFEWQPVDSAVSYNFQLSTKDDFSVIALNRTDIGPAFFIRNGFELNKIYYWRVRSSNSAGFSDWSPVYKFSTGNATAVEEINQLPEDYSLSNYPNPFNPSTTIEFNLPVKEFVSLEVFNILGNKISTLINEEKSAGKHSIKFNPETASGVYFYVLRTPSKYIVKKMELLR